MSETPFERVVDINAFRALAPLPRAAVPRPSRPQPRTPPPLEPQAPLGPGRGAEVGKSWGLRHTADQPKFSFRPGSGHCILARRPESDRVM